MHNGGNSTIRSVGISAALLYELHTCMMSFHLYELLSVNEGQFAQLSATIATPRFRSVDVLLLQ